MPHWGWGLLATVVLTFAAIVLFIWIPWHNESWAIRQINQWGGHVEIQAFAPPWLQKSLGKDRISQLKVFDRITAVRLSGKSLSDADASLLGDLTSTKRLDLDDTGLTDDGLAHLNRLIHLTALHLDRTAITDEGVPHLGAMTNLQDLTLDGTNVTEDGIEKLTGLKDVKILLSDCYIIRRPRRTMETLR
jgi:hypothetical protein